MYPEYVNYFIKKDGRVYKKTVDGDKDITEEYNKLVENGIKFMTNFIDTSKNKIKEKEEKE